MNNWARIGVFDLETTGVDVDTARIVSACIAILDPDGSVVARWDWLADPGIEIPAGAAAVHGITTERAQAMGRDARDVVSEIAQTLRVIFGMGVPLVVYNAPYDLTLLDRECGRHGVKPLVDPSPVIDPLVLDKVVDKYRKGKRTLEVTAGFYDIELDDAHDAGADAIAAGRVALALAAAHPEQLDMPLVQLHDNQIGWYAEQAASFADYIRRVKGDQDFVAETQWPVRTSEHPTSILDTQPIAAPSPRPSLRVPHLDFDTGVLVLDRPALEAAPSRAASIVVPSVEVPAVEVPAVEVPAVEEPDREPWSLGAAEDDAEVAHQQDILTTEPVTGPETASGELWTGVEFDVPDIEVDADAGEPSHPTEDAPTDAEMVDAASARAVLAESAPDRPVLRPTVLRVAAAIITDAAGRTLLVRKRGTSAFMQAGGKIERGESAINALSRELLEEIGLELDLGVTEYLGSFRAEAANEPETVIRAEVFALTTTLDFEPTGEIDELIWIESEDPEGIELAPLTRETILPLWISRRASRF